MLNKSRVIIIVVITLILGGLTILNFKGNEATEDAKVMPTLEITTTLSKETTTTKKTTTKKTTTKAGTYQLTHYGPDCKRCDGITASGYNVSNTIYYNDKTYGRLRIVAMKDLQLYSVIKIKDYRYEGDIYAIVLDIPKNYGIIDLLVEDESKASQLGIQKGVEIQIIRSGK